MNIVRPETWQHYDIFFGRSQLALMENLARLCRRAPSWPVAERRIRRFIWRHQARFPCITWERNTPDLDFLLLIVRFQLWPVRRVKTRRYRVTHR